MAFIVGGLSRNRASWRNVGQWVSAKLEPNRGISHFDVLFLDSLQFFLSVVEEDAEEEVGEDADEPDEVDGAGDALEHLDLGTLGVGAPVHFEQSVDGSDAVVDDAGEEDGERIECEAHLAARHHTVDAVVQQPHHVDQRHQERPSAHDRRSVVDEVQELQVVGVRAHHWVVHLLRHVRYDQHAQVVHLRRNAEGVDQPLDRALVLRHMLLKILQTLSLPNKPWSDDAHVQLLIQWFFCNLCQLGYSIKWKKCGRVRGRVGSSEKNRTRNVSSASKVSRSSVRSACRLSLPLLSASRKLFAAASRPAGPPAKHRKYRGRDHLRNSAR